jgi:poly(3-hydroxybutyrate) depolymerase
LTRGVGASQSYSVWLTTRYRAGLLAVVGLIVSLVLSLTAHAQTVTLSTNGTIFHQGDVHILSASATSPSAIVVDVYVVVRTPSGDLFSLVGANVVAPGLTPFLTSLALPAGFNLPSTPIFSMTLPTLPTGAYTWLAGFTVPGTLTVVSNLAQAQWSFEPQGPHPTYTTENRSIQSSGETRTFLLARPSSGSTTGLPLVILLHGDGGNGTGLRPAFQQTESNFVAVYAYPDGRVPDPAPPAYIFEYYSLSGRIAEAQFLQDLIAALSGEFSINTGRVFVGGISGGATMSNALGCYLGPSVIRGLGINSGTLYPTEPPDPPDFEYMPDGVGVFCPPGQNAVGLLPAAIIVWGTADVGGGTEYDPNGLGTLNTYKATQGCATTTTPGPHSPCVIYNGCTRTVQWCAIEGMGHALWSGAPEALATFFGSLP